MWLPEKTGTYSSKSGYALSKVYQSNIDESFNWRSCIWNVKCSPKIKHFLWKMKNDAVAVGSTLLKRGIQVDGTCKRCGEQETTIHLFTQCAFAKKVWELVPSLFTPAVRTCASITELLRLCTRLVNLPPTGISVPLYPWILWLLWTNRIKLLFEDKSFNESELVTRALVLAREWQSTSLPAGSRSDSPKDSSHKPSVLPSGFEEASPDTIHYYVDAAWNSGSTAGGFGWICYDHAGLTLRQGTSSRRYVASALVAEALALKSALSDAVNAGVKDLICFSDSKSLVALLSGKSYVTELQGIISDISLLSLSLLSVTFKFVPRSCNMAADSLAKNALYVVSNSFEEGD